MSKRTLAALRLTAQQIAQPRFEAPADLVAWLGAVQAQDYAGSRWALALRLGGRATDASIERALDDGAILRTHAFRGTWQIVAPADVRWILALVGARVVAKAARRHRELGLDAATLKRSHAAIARALEGGAHLTRSEIATVLSRARVSPEGQRLSHILAHAELEALVCNGARRGKQSTHALLDQRVKTKARTLARDEALAELARRYFTSRGPATLEDFVWWTGLTTTDARAGLEAVASSLVRETFLGKSFFRGEGTRAHDGKGDVHLLPAFDEWLIAYRDRGAVLDPVHVGRLNAGGGMLDPCVVADGVVIGTWKRTLAGKTVSIAIEPFEKKRPARRAFEAAARRYAGFLGLEPIVAIG